MYLFALLAFLLPFDIFAASPDSFNFQFNKEVPVDIQENSILLIKNKLYKFTPSFTTTEKKEFLKKIPDIIKYAAKPYGYFKIQCKATYYNTQKKPHTVAIKCFLNKPLEVKKVYINILGPGKKSISKKLLKNPTNIKIGSIFTSDAYDQAKKHLLSIAYNQGYIDANNFGSNAEIHIDKNIAIIKLILNTNNIFSFGDVIIKENIYDKNFLRNFSTFKYGDTYSSNLTSAYQKSLQDSELFNELNVKPLFNQNKSLHKIPIQVNYTPINKTQYRFGIGYNSDTYINLSSGATINRLNNKGSKITADVQYSPVKSYFISSLNIPRKHPTYNFYSIDLSYKDEEIIDTNRDKNLLLDFNLNIVSPLKENFYNEKIIGIILETDWSRQGSDDIQRTNTLYPKASINYILQRPSNNIKHSFGGSFSATSKLLSNISFIKSELYANTFIPNLYGFRMILKTSFGVIVSEDTLPLSWYYRTGGTYTVRGFTYNSIGNTEITDNKMLFTGSTEIQRNIYSSFYSNLFLDLGNVSSNIFNSPASYAVGTGLIWESPFGNFEASIGWPIKNYSIYNQSPTWHIALKRGF